MTPSEKAIQYAQDVVGGVIPACKYVVLACKRFLSDLERDWEYVFDRDRADRAVRFMELLPHTKGKWAAKKQLLTLEPWQCFAECNIFGWIHKETGLRRFRKTYEKIPRKNGKSARAAARGVFMFCADEEAGAEVYSGATTEKQAYEVYRPAWQMVQKTPGLRNRFGVEQAGNGKNPGPMYVTEDMSRFETLIGKPGDGSSPHCAIIDEYHEHDTDHMVDAMQTGMGAREQPLLSIITTAGSNLAGPCYELEQDVIRVLEGQIQDESLFGILYGIDEDDDWRELSSLIKANPNYGVSVFEDFLASQLREAIRSPSKQNSFKTKHLNVWVGAASPWMNMLSWQLQGKPERFEEFRDSPCHGHVDLASRKDCSAIVLLWEKGDESYTKQWFFVPESALETNPKYITFQNTGELVVTPGNKTDQAFIEEKVKELHREFDIRVWSFDDYQGDYIMTRLMDEGLPVINYGQTVKNFSTPMKEIEADILDRKLWHDGNQCMTWMIGNVAVRVDEKDNIFPRKSNKNDDKCKIDGPVSLIACKGTWLAEDEPANPGVVYV